MKALILSTVLLVAPMVASAELIPGGPVVHDLGCKFVQPIVGVGYTLKVTTQALAPRYNVRGITLVSRVVYPNAPEREMPLTQASQDENQATFTNGEFTVVLDKPTFSANVFTAEGKHLLICSQ